MFSWGGLEFPSLLQFSEEPRPMLGRRVVGLVQGIWRAPPCMHLAFSLALSERLTCSPQATGRNLSPP